MASSKGAIVFVGTEEEFLAQVSPEPGAVTVDGQGMVALHPVDIVPTFMGAHDVPPEYRDRREEYVRRLIDAGAAVALATDFNPGSSNLSAMPFVLQLGVFTLGMTVEEAINACTGNAAYAVGRHETIGSLEPGKKMDLVLCDLPGYVSLAYEAGRNPVHTVIKNGRVAVADGRRVGAR